MKLSIIVPAHNEQENVEEVITKIEQVLDIGQELVVVNDHSTDNTAPIVQGLCRQFKNLRLVENKMAPGFANALKTGFQNAEGELILPVMGDLCDDLSSIKPMLAKIGDGYDIVCGCRYTASGARLGGSRLKAFLSSFGGRSLRFLLGLPTSDITNAFKIYKKKVIDSITIESCGFEISMEIPLKAYYMGFKIAEVPTVWRERTKGKTNFKVFKLLPRYIKLYLWAIFKSYTR